MSGQDPRDQPPEASIVAARRRFEDRRGFDSAVLEVVAAARKSLLMIDRDFSTWPIESAAFEQTLRTRLLEGVTLRLLVADPDWLSRYGARFLRLRRTFSGRIECRRTPEWMREIDSAIVADRIHVARRIPPDRMSGMVVSNEPTLSAAVCERPDAVWEDAEPCLPATTLGL